MGAFPPSVRRAILEWIFSARRPSTRKQRIARIAADAAAGRRANQWRRPGPASGP
ncbi:YdeI/OmpD-associated family protein [Streptomyces sp. NRRL B-24484]|uniref:YdeI/OmpD-associated family protein n=1 Tax=Streptomyces sp. NRRL B-24484 TaxID=1463833 RepID=UPI0009978883